jgi:hypothetical protein
MSLSLPDAFSGLSVIVAGLAALVASVYSRRTLIHSENAERSAALANYHNAQANILSANTWIDQYLNNVRIWADEASECISRAMHATRLQPAEQSLELYEAMYRLSSLVDRGRWFFPNQWSDEVGLHKEPAYRGLRQPILDHLVNAYDLVKAVCDKTTAVTTADLVHQQRLFVSEVQRVLNPRRRTEEVARIESQFAISQQITEAVKTGR